MSVSVKVKYVQRARMFARIETDTGKPPKERQHITWHDTEAAALKSA